VFKFLAVVLVVIAALSMTACYINEPVASNEVAAQMDGGRITNIVGPGVQSDWGMFAELRQVSCDTLTVDVSDPSVATKETQVVGIKATIQVKRKCDSDSVKQLLTSWVTIASNNEELSKVVSAVAAQGIKVGARTFTMEELLNDRNKMASTIEQTLNENVAFPVDIVAVVVNDVSPSDSYLKILQDKADYTAKTSAELQRQALIRQQASNQKLEQEQAAEVSKQQLLAEQAKTNVELEIASREGKKIAAQYDVYQTNRAAYDLRRMELLKGILGDKSTMYFLQPDQLLNLFLGNNNGIVPVQK